MKGSYKHIEYAVKDSFQVKILNLGVGHGANNPPPYKTSI